VARAYVRPRIAIAGRRIGSHGAEGHSGVASASGSGFLGMLFSMASSSRKLASSSGSSELIISRNALLFVVAAIGLGTPALIRLLENRGEDAGLQSTPN
jgi:hypothetical protein